MSEQVQEPEETALYRVRGDGGLLLYIGISKDFGRRWKEHAKLQPWWPEKRSLSVDVWYPSRAEAEEAEEAAIKAEKPKYNKRHLVPVPAEKPKPLPVKARKFPLAPGSRSPEPAWMSDPAAMRAYLDRVMSLGPRHPLLVSPLEMMLANPASADSIVARLPEGKREFARTYLAAWRSHFEWCTRTVPMMLSELSELEQRPAAAAFVPDIRKLRATLRKTAFGEACPCCNDEPPAGMTCRMCAAGGPEYRARPRLSLAGTDGAA